MHRIIKIVLFIGLISGCTVHDRVMENTKQGVIIKDSSVGQLKKGMTREEVLKIMGSSNVYNFNDERWEYVMYHKKRGKVITHKTLILSFINNELEKIDYKNIK